MNPQEPPPILQIVQERLKPDAEIAYGKIEEELAQLCAPGQSQPLPRPGIAHLAERNLVVEYVCTAGRRGSRGGGLRERYRIDGGLGPTVQRKKGLATEPIDKMTTFRPDLSDSSPWRIGELPLAVVLETRTPAKAAGAVFQSPEGGAFVFAAADRVAEADRLASALGRGARMFTVRPEWRRPYESRVALNQGLWRS
jgi:hypothetical protein